ncbi:MAG: hypothetical protein JHC95_13760 [Solirubrobacteraceae bacterium]|nr:hypothetical protein [Solirubrobacteraceae bacterium]
MTAVVHDALAPREQEVRLGDDRCPGALRLHEAADGFLARVRVPGGRLSAGQLYALADVGAELGSGLVDLTSRANLQLRGLRAESGGPLAIALADAGLLPSSEHERVRNILASPLAGREAGAQIDAAALTDAVDAALCGDPALAGLPGKFQFGIDVVDGVDVALVAVAPGVVELVLNSSRTGLYADVSAGAELAMAAARAFLAARTTEWRVSELGVDAVLRRLPWDRVELTPDSDFKSTRSVGPGRTTQADGAVALTALVPLGRLDAAQLRGLAALGFEARVSQTRSLTLVDVPATEAERVEAALRALELVLDPDSGWRGLTACAGTGGCPRARLDVRAAARTRAGRRGPTDLPEHWSACERRCGQPASGALAIAQTDAGLAVGDEVLGDLTTVMSYLEDHRS